ncbi:transmembrane protein, putative, partial [Bodo saltans]
KPSQSNSIFKVVLVPASVDCNSSLVLSSTLLNSSTPYTASYTESSVLGSYTDIKVSFPRPMVPGLYVLCSGVEPSGALTNTTNTTSMTTISTVRVLDIASPAFMTTPDDWLAASTTPPSPPTSSSWTFYFDGLVNHLNVTVDAAAVVIGKESAVNCSNTSSHALRSDNSTTAMPLTDVVPGRVAWVVPASVIAALGNSILQTEITFCYRRNDVVNINNGWRAVPSYHSLSANITGVVLAPYLSAAPLTPSPTTTTTTLPPATTTTTLAPSPTVVGGCPVTTTGALASFGNSQALRFIVNASWSNAMLSNFKSTASTALCVATDDVVGIYQYRQGTNWCVILEIATRLTPVNKNGVIYGPYNGYSRMAAFVYDMYPSNGALYRSNFGILSVQQISETDPDSSGSSDSVAQLVVGVAIAGVISVLICSCGLVYLCCKRLRRRLNHRVRDPNIVAHVDELTVIPRALVIEARARVVIARRVPRNPEDPPGSSSHSDNASDSDASTAEGAVLERTSSDAQRAAAARRRMAANNGNEQEMTEIIDSTVYGPADRGESIGYSAPAPPMIQGVPLPRRVRGAPTQPRLSTPPNDPAAVSSSNPLSTPPSSDPDKRRLVVANTPPYELKPSAFSDADAEVDGSILPHLVAVTGGSGSQRSGVRSQSGHITITVGTPPVRRSTELE